MHRPETIPLRVIAAAALCTLFCAGICSADASDHPVVTGITGPSELNDGYGPSGTYTFTAAVSGGSPPYMYKWYGAPASEKLISSGPGSSVQVEAKQLHSNGPGRYWIYLTVTDSAGRDAIFARETGGTSNEYCYGLMYDFSTASNGYTWTKVTCPQKFPTPAPARADAARTAPTAQDRADAFACTDTGTRFVGVNGQVEILRACKGTSSFTHEYDVDLAKLDKILYYEDHIKTDDDASAILGFTDMSTFTLKPDSEIILSYPPKDDSKLKIVLGNIWLNVKEMAKNGGMVIDMNQAVAGIKGTTLVCSSDGTTDTVQVIEGTVEVTSKANHEKVLVGEGQQVKATSWGVTDPAPFDVAAVTADWDAVKAKTMAGKPAAGAPNQKSGLETAIVIAGTGIAAAAVAIRRL